MVVNALAVAIKTISKLNYSCKGKLNECRADNYRLTAQIWPVYHRVSCRSCWPPEYIQTRRNLQVDQRDSTHVTNDRMLQQQRYVIVKLNFVFQIDNYNDDDDCTVTITTTTTTTRLTMNSRRKLEALFRSQQSPDRPLDRPVYRW